MTKYRTHIAGVAADARAEHPECPGCGRFRVVRSDTNLCEPCTAKTPAYRQSWEKFRRRAAPVVRSEPGPREPFCLVCCKPLGDRTDADHRKWDCPERPHVCAVCGTRFLRVNDLNDHRRRMHVPR